MTIKLKDEDIKRIHEELEGKCQKCGQRCDKRVVSFIIDTIMVCPDCKNGVKPPVFKITEEIITKVSKISNWGVRETKQFLEILPLAVAMVEYTENTRRYWNWDKSKYIYTIETDHEGNYISIKFYKDYWSKGKKKKKKKFVYIKKKKYVVIGQDPINVKKIKIKDEFRESLPREEKIQSKIDYYENNNEFEKGIVVINEKLSQHKPYTLIDGYTTFLASKQLKLKSVPALIVEEINM